METVRVPLKGLSNRLDLPFKTESVLGGHHQALTHTHAQTETHTVTHVNA